MVQLDQQIAALPSDLRSLKLADTHSRRLAARIKIAVRRATDGKIHWLAVEVAAEGIVLRGRCATFYAKQLAQHAAMRISGDRRLVNAIEVG